MSILRPFYILINLNELTITNGILIADFILFQLVVFFAVSRMVILVHFSTLLDCCWSMFAYRLFQFVPIHWGTLGHLLCISHPVIAAVGGSYQSKWFRWKKKHTCTMYYTCHAITQHSYILCFSSCIAVASSSPPVNFSIHIRIVVFDL